MMYRPNIKAGQIGNLTDARYFAAWAVEWLGFSLEAGQSEAISLPQALAIKEWVEGPKFIGEFSGLDVDIIHQAVRELNLDAVEVSRFADLSVLDLSVPIWVNIVVEKEMGQRELKEILESKKSADYILVDFEKNNIDIGSDLMDRDFLKELTAEYATLFIKCQNMQSVLEDLLSTVQPSGIALVGGEEEMVGVKTFDELDDIFEALEEVRMTF